MPRYTIYIKNSISVRKLKLVDKRLGSKQAIERDHDGETETRLIHRQAHGGG